MNLPLPPVVDRLVHELKTWGFQALVVGGAVRDALLGIDPKDIDVEVYGIRYDRLADLLGPHGRIDLVGRSFGVIHFSAPDGTACDFSVPRRDSRIGVGHRDFLSTFDETMTPRDAASRRDFTINSLAFDPLTGEILDFFHGRADLERRILRATSEAFSEDPLRVLRGMQFACRFDMTLDGETAAMCRSIADQYSTISVERVCEEFMKWAIKSAWPGRIAPYLAESGWMVHFPEIKRMMGVPQDPEWHPEGDVGIHTMHVVNAAARIAERDRIEGDDRAVLLFAALSHDFAKADTTELRMKDGVLRWTAYGHEPASGPLARRLLERIGIKSAIVEQVVPLVENHLAHSSMGPDASPRSVRRLAMRLAPASIAQLVRLMEADASGRPPMPPGLPEGAARLRDLAAEQAVNSAPPSPLILGRHVMPYFGGRPGRHIGEVTAAAYEAQLDGTFSTIDEALHWLDSFMSAKNLPPV